MISPNTSCTYSICPRVSVHLAYGLCIGVCVVFYAFTVARITEGRTSTIRNFVRGSGRSFAIGT